METRSRGASLRLKHNIQDHSPDIVNFVHPNAVFPDNEPFLKRHAKRQLPLQGDVFIAKDSLSGASLKVHSEGVDQIFVWRDKGYATLETIYADAYPSNDPHLIKTWKGRTHFFYSPASTHERRQSSGPLSLP